MVYAVLLSPQMDPTPASQKHEEQIKGDKLKWKLKVDKVRHQALVESLCENKQTKSMGMEFQKLYTGILNGFKCLSNEKRMDFADRLIAQFLIVLNLGGAVTPVWCVERLLNGLKSHPKYQLEAYSRCCRAKLGTPSQTSSVSTTEVTPT